MQNQVGNNASFYTFDSRHEPWLLQKIFRRSWYASRFNIRYVACWPHLSIRKIAFRILTLYLIIILRIMCIN
jgi:hypothetical protein